MIDSQCNLDSIRNPCDVFIKKGRVDFTRATWETVHTPSKFSRYWEIHALLPRDFLRLCPRELSRSWGWFSQYLPHFGGARLQGTCLFHCFAPEYYVKWHKIEAWSVPRFLEMPLDFSCIIHTAKDLEQAGWSAGWWHRTWSTVEVFASFWIILYCHNWPKL